MLHHRSTLSDTRQTASRLLLAAALLLACLTLAAPAAAEDPVTVTTFSDLKNALAGTAPVIIIGADIDVTQTLSITREVTITTDGTSRSLNAASSIGVFFSMYSGSTSNLTLIGNGTGSLTLDGKKDHGYTTQAFQISGGILTINDGVIITNFSNNFAPALVAFNQAVVTMNGGKITNNLQPYGGDTSAVLIDTGTVFTMNGGEISGNKGGFGGVSLKDGSSPGPRVIMNGGKITGNSAEIGGGVYIIAYNAIFEMNGGEISGNTASGNGGGVYIAASNAVFQMTGGEISGNTASGNGDGIYVDSSGSLSVSGSAVVDADNDVYLSSGKFITVPAAFTGSVNSITGDADVLTVGYKMVQTQNGVLASDILGKFHPGDPTRYLTTNVENNALTLDASHMPATASASAVIRNSTIADISFTLAGGPDTVGATGARVNLTDTGGSVISETIARSISPGETVSGIQFTGLTPGVPYRLTITLRNETAGGTPRVYTHPSPVITPVIDRIDIFDSNGNVSGTTVPMVSGDRVACTVKIWNGSTALLNESVSWTATGANISLSPATGTATTVTALQGGTGTVTASLSSGSTSSSFSVLIFNDLPDTLALTANVTNYDVDQSVNLTANLTNSTSGSRYDNIAVSITNTGSPIVSGLTGSPITWTSVPEGTYTLTANVTAPGGDVRSSPVTITLPVPMPEVTAASAFAWNSTTANVSFTLKGGTGMVGATGVLVNLTDIGGVVIAENITRTISAGDTVSDIQLSGLTAGVPYQLTITPLNESAYGTLRVYTHSDLLTFPIIDLIDISDDSGSVSGTTVHMVSGDAKIYTTKIWNGSTELVNESVSWTSAGTNISFSTVAGASTTVTAVQGGTDAITASASSGSSSSFSVLIFNDLPDTLTLSTNTINTTTGNSVILSALLTNMSSGARYDDIAVNITRNGDILLSGVTGQSLAWKPAATGVSTLTANATVMGSIVLSAPIAINVTDPPHPVPTSDSSDGHSSATTTVINAVGRGSFGTGTGITDVSFSRETSGTVTLETRPNGVSAPENAHSVVEISAPAFEGSAEISFSVPLAILRDQGLGVNDVALHHYVNGQWVKLPTFYVGEERGAANYVATTTCFSPFAIVYESGGAQTVERSAPQPTTDAGTAVTSTAKPTAVKTSVGTSATAVPTTSAATGGATAVPTMTQAPVPVAGVLLGLLAVAGVLIRRRE